MALDEALAKRYKDNTRIHRAVIDACMKHIKNNLGDRNTLQKLASEDDYIFWQQFSEVLLAHQLINFGIQPSHQDVGPDFLIELDGKKIWIEIITPEPNGIPEDWVNYKFNTCAVKRPNEEILLRWTSAISSKVKVLMGDVDKRRKGYLEKGIVSEDDAYVIAVNARLLRGFGGAFPELEGLSQLPFAVEATFGVGPFCLQIQQGSPEVVSSGHQERPSIVNKNEAEVPVKIFLDPYYAPISAIWAVDIDEELLIGKPKPMVVVHNPTAANPVPRNFLPADSEFIANDQGQIYQLECLNGRMSNGLNDTFDA